MRQTFALALAALFGAGFAAGRLAQSPGPKVAPVAVPSPATPVLAPTETAAASPSSLVKPASATEESSDAEKQDVFEADRPSDGKPHPISPEHVELHEELALFDQGSAALAARDADALRTVAGAHRTRYPDRNEDVAVGYDILADCLERPGPTTTARAQRFFDEETHSTMRRPILRTCLE